MSGAVRELDKANETGVVVVVAAMVIPAATAPAVLGGGVPGGVVSIPLSSIIFLQLQQTGETFLSRPPQFPGAGRPLGASHTLFKQQQRVFHFGSFRRSGPRAQAAPPLPNSPAQPRPAAGRTP